MRAVGWAADKDPPLDRGGSFCYAGHMTNSEETTSMSLICARCKKRFVWSATDTGDFPPLYHSISCRKSQTKHRAALRAGRPDLVGKCHRPEKKVFENTRQAWEWIAEHHPDDHVVHPYRCLCGALHIGHHSKVN